jgi:two-component system cell cycle response regulator
VTTLEMKDPPRAHPVGCVLVVDDSAVVRAIVSQYLESAGYHVQAADSGEKALALLDANGFDVIVTDLTMPGLDGFGVLEGVKKRGVGTEVIILTGTQDLDAAIRALRLGAHDFLTKPPSRADEVVLTVERALEKKRLRETNARLLLELETLSRTDGLTGLPNRRVFDESLSREVARASRYDYPLSLVLLDLDHFKAVNDAHGHPAGDAVLKSFSALAQAAFRMADAVHRYGGEEFAVLLPHTPFEGAMTATERLRDVIAEHRFPIGSGTVRITLSGGIALRKGAIAPADLLAAADAALYEAKHEGRNRVHGAG